MVIADSNLRLRGKHFQLASCHLCFCDNFASDTVDDALFHIVPSENQCKQLVSLYLMEAGKHVELCAANACNICEVGISGIAFNLPGAGAIAACYLTFANNPSKREAQF